MGQDEYMRFMNASTNIHIKRQNSIIKNQNLEDMPPKKKLVKKEVQENVKDTLVSLESVVGRALENLSRGGDRANLEKVVVAPKIIPVPVTKSEIIANQVANEVRIPIIHVPIITQPIITQLKKS